MPQTRFRARHQLGLAAVVALLPAITRGETGAPADWSATAKLDGEAVRISAWFDDDRTRGFFRVDSSPAPWTSKLYRAWTAHLADVDGDGNDELLAGVWSDHRRHAEPDPHRTVWVLGWDGEKLVERWRGSALARPLVDFAARDLDGTGPDELVAYERGEEGCWLTAYQWTGFGFASGARAAVPCGGQLHDDACLSANDQTRCPSLTDQQLELQ